ncbi:unnamed protein product, partial [Brassica oleracea var. botrytis]
RKKTEEKHELEEEIGGSENSLSASSENSTTPSNPPENSPEPSNPPENSSASLDLITIEFEINL